MLLGLPFDSEDGGNMFETSVYTSSGLQGVTYGKTVLVIGSVCYLPLAGFFLGLRFDIENEATTFL
jgi:hypothetical protein